MSDTLVARVTIKEIGVRNINSTEVVTLKTDQGSFQFWEFKKDGSNTKAYLQYKKFRFSTGDSVEVHYSERISNDINPNTNKPYVNRSVLFFGETNDVPNGGNTAPRQQNYSAQVPSAAPAPAPAQNQLMGTAAMMGRLSDVESKVAILWGERGVSTPATVGEIPTINIEDIDEAEEIRIEDVPF